MIEYKILQNSTPTSYTTTRPYPSAARITKSVRVTIRVPNSVPLDVTIRVPNTVPLDGKDKCNDSLLYQYS